MNLVINYDIKISKEAFHMSYLIHKELSNKVLGLAYNVHNTLGPGLLEHAY